ncbi:MAG: hypothetical protein ACOX0X_01325 [Candidatus Dojkabacteria bacterium]
MQTIPPMYWMIIIGVLVGFFSFILFEIALLIKESRKAVADSRDVIQKASKTVDMANTILEDATEIVSTVKGTVYELNSAIVSPVRKISSILAAASGFVEGIVSKRE